MRPVEYPDEAIIAAGQALQAEGRRITAFALRQRVGGGDPVRIRTVWLDYLVRCNQQTAAIVKETLPAEFAVAVEELNTTFLEQWRHLATRLYQLARDSAEARVREALQTARTVQEQAEAEMADAQQNALAQDTRIEELTGQYEEAQQRLRTLLQEQEERAQQLATLDSRWQQAQAEMAELRDHLNQAQAATAAATGKATAEVERRQQAEQELQAVQALLGEQQPAHVSLSFRGRRPRNLTLPGHARRPRATWMRCLAALGMTSIWASFRGRGPRNLIQ